MAIVKMNKFTLYAFESQRRELLQNLQKFEGVQFTNLQEKINDENLEFLKSASQIGEVSKIESEIAKIKFSIDFLNRYIEKEGGLKALKAGKKTLTFDELNSFIEKSSWESIYKDLKEKDEKMLALHNEKTKLLNEIEFLYEWSSFDAPLKDLKALKLTEGFIGSIQKNFEENVFSELEKEIPDVYYEKINESKTDVFIFVLIQKQFAEKASDILKNLGFSKATIDYSDTPLNVIKNHKDRISSIDTEVETSIETLKEMKNELDEMELAFEYYSNELEVKKVCENFVKSEKVVAIEGWNTLESNEELEEIVKNTLSSNYYLEFKEVEDSDVVPIKLQNSGLVEPFESITEMYSLPNYKEIDPTPILSIFYFVFFGMMLSDAGYGVIMVIGTILSLKLFKLEKGTKNFMKLFLYLGISTTIWGVIYGGYFGDAPESLFNKPAHAFINSQEQIMLILGIAVAMGIVHIFTGLAIKAYVLIRNGKPMDAIYDVLTWYVTLIGLGLLLGGIGGSAGKILTIVGVVSLLLTQGRDAKSIGGKIGGGIYGLYGITSYIGDVVSYSRLLALGLATGFIANAFNLMANLIPKPAGYVFGLVIFLFGHLFNLGINALGAYVHTSRLQYLEFFNKFYEGGGKKFNPLKSTSKYVNITDK
ncbi:V-type ATP synthase subunit I [Clostridium sp. DL1XJH146]